MAGAKPGQSCVVLIGSKHLWGGCCLKIVSNKYEKSYTEQRSFPGESKWVSA